ncbi:MAG: polysaccharide biosynthesis/export family protein, partial [Planctomycetota bacterium]|nr:polysaccharide biosynthesis/export family protein [Planctomycetota bacterium]
GMLAVAGLASSLGCEVDAWLFDPSVVGRWEHTPTVVPILDRIDVIERDRGDFVETTPVMPEDLIPEVEEYVVGPGDVLVVEIFDFPVAGAPTPYQLVVDVTGAIRLPQVGQIQVSGLTLDEITQRIREVLREEGIIEDALVTITPGQQRRATYSVFGAVAGVGRYFIPDPDYRLLEAVTEAGGVSPIIRKVYVIRQVALTSEAERGRGAQQPQRPRQNQQQRQQQGTDLIDLIDELTEPAPPGGMGLVSADPEAMPTRRRNLQDTGAGSQSVPPLIDLIDEPGEEQPRTEQPAVAEASNGEARWMFLNGEWVRVTRQAAGRAQGLPEGEDPLAGATAEQLVTQRVIEVPTAPLLQGAADYNIVIRPGDIIRVPSPEAGVVYIGGPGILRPGTYNLPQTGRLTLSKSVIAAGGLSAIAIPWKVDLTRMVGENQQATIRLDLKAIVAGAQPDVFLKPDDVINVGTSFWAQPMAVVRNGFRMTYGFGFLVDRNFGNDIFGAPPVNRFGQ